MAFTSHFNRRCLAGALALGASLWASGAIAADDNFPSKPIRIIVPFTPGGVTDTSARLVAEHLGRRLNQQIVIDNKPGASGNICSSPLMPSLVISIGAGVSRLLIDCL